jgi:hypothetical protein
MRQFNDELKRVEKEEKTVWRFDAKNPWMVTLK